MNYRIPVLSFFSISVCLAGAIWAGSSTADAQTRPRRVKPAPTPAPSPTPESLLGPAPKSAPTANNNAPLLDVKPAKPVGAVPASTSGDTMHAYQLFQQKQYANAAKEAKAIATND